MVSVPEPDLSWEGYELWEKVEARERRKRRLWVAGAVLAFLALSSVPILMDRSLQWRGRALARELSEEIATIKREALTRHRAMRLRIPDVNSLEFTVESPTRCQSSDASVVRSGRIGKENETRAFRWVSPAEGRALGLGGLTTEFCYDPIDGFGADTPPRAFVLAPREDLGSSRTDRMAFVRVASPIAEISFE